MHIHHIRMATYKCRKTIIIRIVSQIRPRTAEIVSGAAQTHQVGCGKIAVIKLVVNGTAKCCTIRRQGGRKPNARAASAGAARGVIHIPSEDTQRA